jgi:ATP-binding cassette subfamily F protein 3
MQYFAQDEANRLEPALTVHETLAAGSPLHMVPMIRNILGGFLFSGDDVYKKVRVLSGGERTRLGVARMLLRPSNALLLDEPTNHLDLDSKEVLLDALVDYGGTLIFVSHDRYFVERLATKIIEIGHGTATVYPGTYKEFLWHKEHREATQAGRAGEAGRAGQAGRAAQGAKGKAADKDPAAMSPEGTRPTRPERDRHAKKIQTDRAPQPTAEPSREDRKRADAEARKKSRAEQAKRAEIDALETQIAATENAIRDLEQRMAAPGFYDDRASAQPLIDEHQALMWKVGDLMHRWEELQAASDVAHTADA